MSEEQELNEEAENVEELDTVIEGEEDNSAEGEEGTEGEVVELEPWEITEEEGDTEKPEKSLKAKKKWKREKAEKDAELEKLKAEVEELKGGSKTSPTNLKRPKPEDFEDDDAYEDAREKYLLGKIKAEDSQKKVQAKQKAIADSIRAGVDAHNERVGEFVEEKKISPDVYSVAESTFIQSIDEVFKGNGDKAADNLLSKLGKGSEKIPYFLGRNKAKLKEFQELLREDDSGIKAAIFLGDLNRKLRGGATAKPKSKAPKPAATANGDTLVKSDAASEKGLKAKYDKAHKEGNGSLALDIKMQAKREHKIDTSKW